MTKTWQLFVYNFLIIFLSIGCQVQKNPIPKVVSRHLGNEKFFLQHHTGISVFDPDKNEYIIHSNGHLLFTPASNTKLLTFLAAKTSLGDSIPTFLYEIHEDTLYLKPLGDPALLNSKFPEQSIIHTVIKLSNNREVVLVIEDSYDRFGTGWAWDDYPYSWQPELSSMPLYGNLVSIELDSLNEEVTVIPKVFQDSVLSIPSGSKRYEFQNLFTLPEKSLQVPFRTNRSLIQKLLRDTLSANVNIKSSYDFKTLPDTLFSVPTDTVLREMMVSSDNLIAEQLLSMLTKLKGFEHNKLFMDDYAKSLTLELPNKFKWIDGSGLSRYNLNTPDNMVTILRLIHQKIGTQGIQTLFSAGGVNGHLKDWYKGDPPYLYAKTGSLGNIHNISGYIFTDSGKILLFSFMNNGFLVSQDEVKSEMENIFEYLRDKY